MAKHVRPEKSPIGSKKKREGRKTTVIRHEQEIAKFLGGNAQPNSGSGLQRKGDVSLDDFLLDSKETEKDSIQVKGSDLALVTSQALAKGKTGGLVITIHGMRNPEWVLIPIEKFKEMLNEPV